MLEFLRKLFAPERSSETAKERLRLVLLSDHLSLAPDTIEALKRDLLEVISRYVEIDAGHADVTFEQREHEVAMLASIPITGVREPSGCDDDAVGAAPQDELGLAPFALARAASVPAALAWSDDGLRPSGGVASGGKTQHAAGEREGMSSAAWPGMEPRAETAESPPSADAGADPRSLAGAAGDEQGSLAAPLGAGAGARMEGGHDGVPGTPVRSASGTRSRRRRRKKALQQAAAMRSGSPAPAGVERAPG